MKTTLRILGLSGFLYFSAAHAQIIVAPAVVVPPPPPPPPTVIVAAPPPGVIVPAGVTYVAPVGVAPAIGYTWRYHVGVGWGWWHPRWGWHERVVVVHRYHYWHRW